MWLFQSGLPITAYHKVLFIGSKQHSSVSYEHLIADKCKQNTSCLLMITESRESLCLFAALLNTTDSQSVVWLGVYCVQPLALRIVFFSVAHCPFVQRNTFYKSYSNDVSRLGESAAGDGLSGHFPVSCVDSVPGPPLLPSLAHQHLDFQMAHCSHHAGSCE